MTRKTSKATSTTDGYLCKNELINVWDEKPSSSVVAFVEDAMNADFATAKAKVNSKYAMTQLRDYISDIFEMPVDKWAMYVFNPASSPIDNQHIPIHNFIVDALGSASSPDYYSIKEDCQNTEIESKEKLTFMVIDRNKSKTAGEIILVEKEQTKQRWQQWRSTQMTNNRHLLCGTQRKPSTPAGWHTNTQKKFTALWNALNAEDADQNFNQATAIKTLNQIATMGKFKIPS